MFEDYREEKNNVGEVFEKQETSTTKYTKITDTATRSIPTVEEPTEERR